MPTGLYELATIFLTKAWTPFLAPFPPSKKAAILFREGFPNQVISIQYQHHITITIFFSGGVASEDSCQVIILVRLSVRSSLHTRPTVLTKIWLKNGNFWVREDLLYYLWWTRQSARPQKKLDTYIHRYICLMNHQETHQTNPMAPWDPLDAPSTPWDPLPPLSPPGTPNWSLGLIEL